jgi:hypothetical protein
MSHATPAPGDDEELPAQTTTAVAAHCSPH